MRVSLILSLVISLLAVAFALVNNETVAVNVGFAYVQGSLALVLLVTLSLGVIVGILASIPGRLKSRRRIRSLEKTIAELKTEPSAQPKRSSSPDGSTAEESSV